MTRAEKATRIQAVFGELYPQPPVPLDHGGPFTLLVAVLLSAQTTDAQVNKVTPGLFALASTPEQMAQLSPDRILREIRSCGLAPTKAKNIHRLSRVLLSEHQGKVPDSLDELEALPGVGHKTASVVMCQAFGRPAFPVDTHIHRLAYRWGLSTGKNVVQTERDLKKVFPRNAWAKVHLQFIYFGRAHCPARGHDPLACPICSWAAPKRRMLAERQAQGQGAEKSGRRRRSRT